MIVRMKKVFLFIQHSVETEALEKLASIGVVHVERENVSQAQGIGEINEKLAVIEQARSILSLAGQKNPVKQIMRKSDELLSVCRHVIDLQKRYDQLREYSVTLSGQIGLWESWGDFDPADIRLLRGENIFIKFYQVPKDKIGTLPEDLVLKKISSQGALVNCLAVSREDKDIGLKELDPPKMSLLGMKNRLCEDAKTMQGIRDELFAHMVYESDLSRMEEDILHQKEFFSVLSGMGRTSEISYLKGYIPSYAEEDIVAQAKQNGWGVLTADPDPGDAVPTLLRNPAWISLIKPVLKLLELVPGYREIDISPLFIVFFSLFFGMLIGDAGYGLVYFLINFWLHKKIGGRLKDKSAFFLFYLLSFCAIIWGLLTGTFFGQQWFLAAGYKPPLPVLNNTVVIQAFCFFIGALHLSLAHAWRAVLKSPDPSALADIGWISVIWAVFFLAKTLLLGDAFPSFGAKLIMLGLVLVLFFTSPQKNIFKAIGAGLGTIALSLVNNFTDVVSYIRLFAVGLAGVAIADAFNSMAAGVVKKGDILTVIIAVLVVVCGHMLNLILGPMSVLVHGVRLNVLEFCSHASVAWDGFAYKPFRKKNKGE